MRLDTYLVEIGLAPSRTKASELIKAGLVWIDGFGVIKKPAFMVSGIANSSEAQKVILLKSDSLKYVSRAGFKLEAALRRTGLNVVGQRAMDMGISTGGFSDCLLQHGIANIVGIDVGHGQLANRLSEEKRIRLFEGVNGRCLSQGKESKDSNKNLMAKAGRSGNNITARTNPATKGLAEEPSSVAALGRFVELPDSLKRELLVDFDIIVVDVSFCSIRYLLAGMVRYLKPRGHLLGLIKPQFELGPGAVGKNGVVTDQKLYESLEITIRAEAQRLSLKVLDYFLSELPGKEGNREFFLWAEKL